MWPPWVGAGPLFWISAQGGSVRPLQPDHHATRTSRVRRSQQIIKRLHQSTHGRCLASREGPVAGENQPPVSQVPASVFGIQHDVIRGILREHGAIPALRFSKQIGIEHSPEVRFLLDRHGIVPPFPQLLGDARRVVLVNEQLQRSISRRRRKSSSASAAWVSTFASQVSISAG